MLQCEKQLHAFDDDKLRSYFSFFFAKTPTVFLNRKNIVHLRAHRHSQIFREIDLSSFKQERRMIQQIFLRRIENIEDTS